MKTAIIINLLIIALIVTGLFWLVTSSTNQKQRLSLQENLAETSAR